MKEATGELNMTVIVVIAVASLTAFFYFTIWPMIRRNMNQNTKCSSAICDKCPTGNTCNTVPCHTKENPNNTFECVWKG